MKRLLVMTAVLALVGAARAEDWPQWRGVRGDGISMDKTWKPAAVAAGKIAWSKDVGAGYSGVAVVKDAVYTMGHAGGKDTVYCLNADNGQVIWEHSYTCGSAKSYPGPRCTPAVDVAGGTVYVLSREGDLYCLDAFKGDVKWKKNMKTDFGAMPPKWAFSSSPRVEGDLLLVNEGANGFALNKKTGEKIWGGPGKGGYSSPVVYSMAGKSYVAVFAAEHAYGVDLKSGAVAWSYPWKTSYDVNAADPVIIGNQVFLSSGYGKGCVLLDISGKPRAMWENKAMRSHFGSFVVKDGFIYGIDGQAGNRKSELRCLSFSKGDVKWVEPTGFGSVSGAGDYLIVLGEKGLLSVVQASTAGYKKIASTQLTMGSRCWTMPVLANGRIYCRGEKGKLTCVDAR